MNNYEQIIGEIVNRVGAGVVDRVASLEWDEGTQLQDIYTLGKNVLSEVLEEEGIVGSEDAVREIFSALTPSFASAFYDVLRVRGAPREGFRVYGIDGVTSLLYKLAPDLDASGDVGRLRSTADEIRSELEAIVIRQITSTTTPDNIEGLTDSILERFGMNYEDLSVGERERWTHLVVDLFTVVTCKYIRDSILQYEKEGGDPASYKLSDDNYWEAVSLLQDSGLIPLSVDSLGALCEYVAKLMDGGSKSQRRARKILSELEPVEDLYEITLHLARALKGGRSS